MNVVQIGEDVAPGKEQDNLDAENKGLSANWSQVILLQYGDSSDQPYIIKTAFA